MQAQSIHRVLGYVRVSTEEQADNGAGLDAQRAAIRAECERRGWELVELIEDGGYSAKNLKRPGIQGAISRLKGGEADALVVAKLDRLSRSLIDFAGLMAQAQGEGWGLVALDLGVDTSTPSGELMANVLASFAQYERRLIGQRTREGMAEKRAQGHHMGRRSVVPLRVKRRIQRQRKRGLSLQLIANGLNADGVPTGQGGAQWYPSSVRAVITGLSD